MRIPRAAEGEETGLINIPSLLDVILILLIFFMATTSFKQEELDLEVQLPQSAANKSLSAATKLIIINIRAADRPKDVRGDRRAFHGDVAAAVTACSEMGVKEVNIGYDRKPTG
jgi:biopolymer transport protein ExbD